MKLIAITTVDMREAKDNSFPKLLSTGLEEVDFWIVVVRTDDGTTAADVEDIIRAAGVEDSSFVTLVRPPCGVSEARNAGLSWLWHSALNLSEAILSFPDDDCYYSPGFASRIKAEFAARRDDVSPHVVLLPYHPLGVDIDRDRWPAVSHTITDFRLLPRVVASAGIFLRAQYALKIGPFDPSLGVGTDLAAAEDLEYVLRCAKAGAVIRYNGSFGVHHEYRPPAPTRALGNVAVMHAYRELFPSLVGRTWGRMLRDRMRRSGSVRALDLLLAIRSYRPKTSNAFSSKRRVGSLRLSERHPEDLVREAVQWLIKPEGSARVIFAAHVTSLNAAERDELFAARFNAGDLAMADGISLALLSRVTPGKPLTKLATTDFAPLLFTEGAAALGRRLRLAVVGGEPDVAQEASSNLERSLPVDVVYSTHGFHSDAQPVLDAISRADVDVLLLGMGMPLEAHWVFENHSAIDASLVVTCGGWLRLLAGIESRAPEIMQRLELEWAWRLLTDPGRTTQRYASGVTSVVRATAKGWR